MKLGMSLKSNHPIKLSLYKFIMHQKVTSNTTMFRSYLNKKFSCLKFVHEVVGVNVHAGVQDIEPFGQILFHGIQIFVGSRKRPENMNNYVIDV